MIYGSLFTGIGGLDLAVESVFKAKCAWQCETDEFCRAVLARHWPGVHCYGDIREAYPPPVDILCGGFPCQDVSSAGAQAGLTGARSGLWGEFRRLIRDLRPRYVVVENVTSGLQLWGGAVLGDLAALGYDAEWESTFAAHAGAPHLRARTIVLGHAHDRSQSTGAIDAKVAGLCSSPSALRDGWPAPPQRVRMDDGVPHGLDRNHTLGNAVCQQQAEFALRRMVARHG